MEGYTRAMAMPPVPESVIRQAEKLRHAGNEYYSKKRFGAAIDAYTEAIVLNPDVAASWTNRAFCFRRKKDWARVEHDSMKAIQLDTSSFKAHYLLGLALLEKKEYVRGIKELEKALDLGKHVDREDHLTEEMRQSLSKAKYLLWEEESSKKLVKLRRLRKACKSALREKHINNCLSGEDEYIYVENLGDLSEVFDEMEKSEKQAEVPEYLCCKISLEIYKDPVITPSGITYERALLLDHLRKVGHFDPTTREPLEQHQLIPNLAIKEAVQAFLEQNGWAYRSMEMPTIVLED